MSVYCVVYTLECGYWLFNFNLLIMDGLCHKINLMFIKLRLEANINTKKKKMEINY